MSGNYDDIIHLPHHVSARRRAMAGIDRAAQFSPFAALTGYEAAVRETARLTDVWIEPDEDKKTALDRALREAAFSGEWITITYFHPDAKKAGGAYMEAGGKIKCFNVPERAVILRDGTSIPLDFIVQVLGTDRGGEEF